MSGVQKVRMILMHVCMGVDCVITWGHLVTQPVQPTTILDPVKVHQSTLKYLRWNLPMSAEGAH